MTSWDITFIRYLHFLYSANIVAIFLFQYFPSMMAPASVLLWLSISRGFANAHTSLRCPWSWWWLSGWWWWLGEHNWGWKPWWIACANTARWRCLVGFYPSNEVSSPETGSTWATSASADRRWTCTEIFIFRFLSNLQHGKLKSCSFLTWKSFVRLQSMVLFEFPHCTELFIKLIRDLAKKSWYFVSETHWLLFMQSNTNHEQKLIWIKIQCLVFPQHTKLFVICFLWQSSKSISSQER